MAAVNRDDVYAQASAMWSPTVYHRVSTTIRNASTPMLTA